MSEGRRNDWLGFADFKPVVGRLLKSTTAFAAAVPWIAFRLNTRHLNGIRQSPGTPFFVMTPQNAGISCKGHDLGRFAA